MAAGADDGFDEDDDLETPGPVIDRVEPTAADVDIPSGLDGPFFRAVGRRKQEGRDAKILVTAADGQTGVGKSNLCDFLGYVLDTSEEGFAPEKTTAEPIRFLELYSVLSPGSSAIMEEGEQFDSRRAMRNENVEASQKWQQARVREIIALVNLPDPTMIDGRFERLCDFWINVERRGKARVYAKKIHPIKRRIYYKTIQTLEWPNMDRSATFKHMDRMKADLIDGELDDDGLIRESEAQQRVERAEKQARQDTRDALLTSLYRETDLFATDIARLSAVEIKASRIRQIASERD